MGLHVVRADFNSPIVDTWALAPETWHRPGPLHGIDLQLERQLSMIEQELAPFIAELDVPLHPEGDRTALHLDNPWYGPMDAHVLYALLRHSPPARILELGSGFSTLIIDRAMQANPNAAAYTHEVIDPFPSPLLADVRGPVRVREVSGAVVEPAVFERLEDGDLLFVDTSHSVRPGGEVVRLVLDVLPTLRPGVLIHFHDIFAPYPYPRILYERFNVHWQEQYLLQAFLAYNPKFVILLSSHALWRAHMNRAMGLFPGLRAGMEPSAFWFRRTATDDPP